MDGPTLTYFVGFIMILIGEMWAYGDDVPKNTISERLWWVMGKGRKLTWFFWVSRIIILGFISWWLLHTAGVDI